MVERFAAFSSKQIANSHYKLKKGSRPCRFFTIFCSLEDLAKFSFCLNFPDFGPIFFKSSPCISETALLWGKRLHICTNGTDSSNTVIGKWNKATFNFLYRLTVVIGSQIKVGLLNITKTKITFLLKCKVLMVQKHRNNQIMILNDLLGFDLWYLRNN